jgi:hypothetical protein
MTRRIKTFKLTTTKLTHIDSKFSVKTTTEEIVADSCKENLDESNIVFSISFFDKKGQEIKLIDLKDITYYVVLDDYDEIVFKINK